MTAIAIAKKTMTISAKEASGKNDKNIPLISIHIKRTNIIPEGDIKRNPTMRPKATVITKIHF